MTARDFQRARRPDEISVRRAAILAAAGALFDVEGPNGTGLNAIAARAGFTKSNVYRYFESRDAVLLHLYLDELSGATEALERDLAQCRSGDLAAIADVIAAAFLARPRLCHLLSILSSVLEQNVSEEIALHLKQASHDAGIRLAVALHGALPSLSLEDCGWTWTMLAVFIAGLWPSTQPPAAVAAVLAKEAFRHMRPQAERDVPRGVLVILRGLMAGHMTAGEP